MKLHATVLATCALTPSIMLEYRPKCRDYMQSIGQDRFTFKTDSLRAGEIWEIVREWGRDRLSAAASLAEAIHSRQEKQRAAAERVTGLLKTF
jgi:polysaccharide pyruvyl transferase WcaK-like protein